MENNNMTHRFSKEELIDLSNATIDKIKVRTIKKVFLMLGITVGVVGVVGASRLLGIDPETMKNIAYAATIADSAILAVTVHNVLVSYFSTKVAKNALNKFEEGQFDSNYYNEQYLESAMEMAGTTREELEAELSEKKGMKM